MLGLVEDLIKQKNITKKLDDNTLYKINIELKNSKYNYSIVLHIKEYRNGDLNRNKTQIYNKFSKTKEDKDAAYMLFDFTFDEINMMDEYDLQNFFI